MLISIITINLNDLSGLMGTFQSVINQTYTDYEFIVVDGCSTDGCVEFICDNSNYFTHIIIEEDEGIYDAMNKGIGKAKGSYLLFLNSGDEFNEHFSLQHAVNALVSDTDLVFLRYKSQQNFITRNLQFSDFWFIFPYCHQAILFKRSLFFHNGIFDKKFKVAADWEFVGRCLGTGSTYEILNLEIVKVDLSGLSNTKDGVFMSFQERKYVLENDYNFFYRDYSELQYFRNAKLFRLLRKIYILFGRGVWKKGL